MIFALSSFHILDDLQGFFSSIHDLTDMIDTYKNAVQIFGEDDIGRESPFLKALHHLPSVSGPSGNDRIGIEREDLLIVEADIASHSRPRSGLFWKIAVNGDAYNLLIKARVKNISVILGAREMILLGGKGKRTSLPTSSLNFTLLPEEAGGQRKRRSKKKKRNRDNCFFNEAMH